MTFPLEYHRPDSVEDALALLGRATPATRPLAGGTGYRGGAKWPAAVVDLSNLPLQGVERRDTVLRIGALITLDALAAQAPAGLREAALGHAPRNIRQRATVGGVVAARDSGPLLAALLALDARVDVEPGRLLLPLEVYLRDLRRVAHLIVAIEVPAARRCALSEIRRAPTDAPIMTIAVGAELRDGGLLHVIAAAAGADQPAFLLPGAAQLLEGAPDADLVALAAVTPQLSWRSDGRGSAEYRRAMTPGLLRRAMSALTAGEASHEG